MFDPFGGPPAEPRTVSVPAVEPARPLDAPADALALFQLPLRDTIDFSVDWSSWLGQCGAPGLAAATFSAAAGSPQIPNVVGQGFTAEGRCTVVMAVASGGKVGDAYWLDLKVTLPPTAPVDGQGMTLPARSITRRVQFVVVEG